MLCRHGHEIPDNATCWYNPPHGEHKFLEDRMSNFEIKSGPGYTLSGSPITGKVTATVQDSSSKEPVRQIASVASIIGSVILVAVQLIKPEWAEVTATVLAILGPLVLAIFTRNKVWSPASVRAVIEEAIKAAEQTKKR